MGIKNNRDENWKNANAREPQLLFACSKLIYLSVILYGRLIKEENVRHQLFLFLGESRAAIDRVQPTIGSVLLSHMTIVVMGAITVRNTKWCSSNGWEKKFHLFPFTLLYLYVVGFVIDLNQIYMVWFLFHSKCWNRSCPTKCLISFIAISLRWMS